MAREPMPDELRTGVIRRSRGLCEAAPLTGCRETGGEIHHRQPRGMGGAAGRHTFSNLIVLCADCHRLVESQRRWARLVGLLVSQHMPTPSVPWALEPWMPPPPVDNPVDNRRRR